MRSSFSFLRRLIPALLVAGAATLGSACTVHGSGRVYGPSADVVVYDPPPPPRRVYAAYRPGYVWVDGRWDWAGGRWLWREGYYVRERPNYVYTPGQWRRASSGRGYVYIQGRWDHRSRVYGERDRPRRRVQDHRY